MHLMSGSRVVDLAWPSVPRLSDCSKQTHTKRNTEVGIACKPNLGPKCSPMIIRSFPVTQRYKCTTALGDLGIANMNALDPVRTVIEHGPCP